MREVRDAIAEILDRTTLAQVCSRIEDARAATQGEEALMFYI